MVALGSFYRTPPTANRGLRSGRRQLFNRSRNRTLKNDLGTRTTSTYDAAEQLSLAVTCTVRTTYLYDQAGNTRSIRATGSMPTTMTWDDENRLDIWNDGATTANLTYNGDGQRVALDRNPGADFRWVWDGQAVLLELDNTNATLEIDTHEPGAYGGLVSRRRLSGGNFVARYCHFDAIGSLDGETDAAGTGYFNRFIYQAFGPLVAEANLSVPTNWRYVGRLGYYYDRLTTGLPVYVRARWLAPSLGRWLSEDPIPQLIWTPYGYAGNRPVGAIDPDGTIVIDAPPKPRRVRPTPRPVPVDPRPLPIPSWCFTVVKWLGVCGTFSKVALDCPRTIGPEEFPVPTDWREPPRRVRRRRRSGCRDKHPTWPVCPAGSESDPWLVGFGYFKPNCPNQSITLGECYPISFVPLDPKRHPKAGTCPAGTSRTQYHCKIIMWVGQDIIHAVRELPQEISVRCCGCCTHDDNENQYCEQPHTAKANNPKFPPECLNAELP